MANTYPIVLVHGYKNKTDTFATAREHIKELGFECYSPHIGPFDGLWDRACELYAMLKGGTVDYGIAHSKRCGHDRFGKTYPGFCPKWGTLDENGNRVKAHFVGHSFGGATIRFLLNFLVEGNEEEKAVTPEGELSPLFEGGNTDWVASVTALASPHNGTTVLSLAGGLVYTSYFMEFSLANVFSGTDIMDADKYDLDKFGFTSNKFRLRYAPDKIRGYLKKKEDNCFYELTPSGADRFTSKFHPYENVYYFSVPAVYTYPVMGGEFQWPKKDILERYRNSAIVMGGMHSKYYSADWRPNDGRVPLASARAPKNEPQQEFDPGENFSYRGDIQKGIWNICPVEDKFHNAYIGEEQDPEEYKEYFQNLARFLEALDA